MRLSIRNERGQAVMEYILTLIIAIAIIFGGIYQLNTAFKAWAANYFGDYLSCLLETGELPSISGTGGDAGTCNKLFKPFSIGEGRRLAAVGKTSGGGAKIGNPVAATERGGGGAGGYNGTPFTAGRTPAKQAGEDKGGGGRSKITGGGGGANAGYENYGKPYTGRSSLRPPEGERVEIRSGLSDTKESTSRSVGGASRSADQSAAGARYTKIIPPVPKAANDQDGGGSFTVGDFMRYLIIAGIIIALLMFLGGQALQIGKSMD